MAKSEMLPPFFLRSPARVLHAAVGFITRRWWCWAILPRSVVGARDYLF